MIGRCYRLLLLPVLLAATAGCHGPQRNLTATDMQMRRMDDSQASFGGHFAYMVDNAILRDMSVADIHFIPHTTEISGIGEVRLARFARLLNTYGGTVRYETALDDEGLIQKRMEHVREYLSLTGCNMDRVDVAVMLPGGAGMPGDEAVEKYRKGTAEPGTTTGSETILPGPGAPNQPPGS